jgi:cyclophilin family peptidyl-prolyl cis-trans isomerase
MRAIGKAIGVGFLVVGIIIGIGGYYLASMYSFEIIKTETVTQTTTQAITTVLTSLSTTTQYSTLFSTLTETSFVTLSSAGGTYAVIDTTQGTIVVQLFPNVAPKTVANFISLANSGFYNNLVWYRIVAGFAIQIGDPTTRNGGGNESTWGQTGSGQTVPPEANATTVAEGYVNNAGYLGMARTSDPNSGNSQFFINLANNTSLNGQYTVFGKVISGLNVVDAIGNLQVNPQCASSGGTNCQPLNPTNAEILGITTTTTTAGSPAPDLVTGGVSCGFGLTYGSTAGEGCFVTMLNDGTNTVTLTGTCSLTYLGNTYPGTFSYADPLGHGQSTGKVTCGESQEGPPAGAGAIVTGLIFLTNGQYAKFNGTAVS